MNYRKRSSQILRTAVFMSQALFIVECLTSFPGGGRDDVFKISMSKQLTYTDSGTSVKHP